MKSISVTEVLHKLWVDDQPKLANGREPQEVTFAEWYRRITNGPHAASFVHWSTETIRTEVLADVLAYNGKGDWPYLLSKRDGPVTLGWMAQAWLNSDQESLCANPRFGRAWRHIKSLDLTHEDLLFILVEDGPNLYCLDGNHRAIALLAGIQSGKWNHITEVRAYLGSGLRQH